MSLDETCLSNGEVYTILTSKAAHGGKGALAAMVRGVASDTVSGILKKVPRELRRRVKTVTTDLSSAMMLTVKTVFPKAMLINDRFHVQQLVTDAIDQMRIGFRWEVLPKRTRPSGNTVPGARPHTPERRRTLSAIGSPRGWKTERPSRRSWHAAVTSSSCTSRSGMPSSRQGPPSSSGCSPGWSRRTTSISNSWTSSTKSQNRQRPGSTWQDGTTRSRRLATMASAKSLRPLRITTLLSSTTSRIGSPMHRQNPSMLKSRLSEHSSEGLGISGSSCFDWLHFILD